MSAGCREAKDMGKIILFPNKEQREARLQRLRPSQLSLKEVLNRLAQLAWEDPESYFWLKIDQLMSVEIDADIKAKLLAMGLIDTNDRALPEVNSALNAVSQKYAEMA